MQDARATPISKVEQLRRDVGVEITKVKPEPGDILLIQPHHPGLIFSEEYGQFLKETLEPLLPLGCKVVIFRTRDVDMSLKKLEAPK